MTDPQQLLAQLEAHMRTLGAPVDSRNSLFEWTFACGCEPLVSSCDQCRPRERILRAYDAAAELVRDDVVRAVRLRELEDKLSRLCAPPAEGFGLEEGTDGTMACERCKCRRLALSLDTHYADCPVAIARAALAARDSE